MSPASLSESSYTTSSRNEAQLCSQERADCMSQTKEQLAQFSREEYGRYLGAIKSYIIAAKKPKYINPKTGKPLDEKIKKNIGAIENAYKQLKALDPTDVINFYKNFNKIVYESGVQDEKGGNIVAQFLDPDGDRKPGMKGITAGFGADIGLHNVKIGNEDNFTSTMDSNRSQKSYERAPDSFSMLEQLDIKIWGKILTPEEQKSEFSKMLNNPDYHRKIYEKAKSIVKDLGLKDKKSFIQALEPTEENRQKMRKKIGTTSGSLEEKKSQTTTNKELDKMMESGTLSEEEVNILKSSKLLEVDLPKEKVLTVSDLSKALNEKLEAKFADKKIQEHIQSLMSEEYNVGEGKWKGNNGWNKKLTDVLGIKNATPEQQMTVVKAFQRSLGVEVDGKFGPKTRAAFFRKQNEGKMNQIIGDKNPFGERFSAKEFTLKFNAAKTLGEKLNLITQNLQEGLTGLKNALGDFQKYTKNPDFQRELIRQIGKKLGMQGDKFKQAINSFKGINRKKGKESISSNDANKLQAFLNKYKIEATESELKLMEKDLFRGALEIANNFVLKKLIEGEIINRKSMTKKDFSRRFTTDSAFRTRVYKRAQRIFGEDGKFGQNIINYVEPTEENISRFKETLKK